MSWYRQTDPKFAKCSIALPATVKEYIHQTNRVRLMSDYKVLMINHRSQWDCNARLWGTEGGSLTSAWSISMKALAHSVCILSSQSSSEPYRNRSIEVRLATQKGGCRKKSSCVKSLRIDGAVIHSSMTRSSILLLGRRQKLIIDPKELLQSCLRSLAA